MSIHVCPIDGCGRVVRLDRLMCPAHWSMVPGVLGREVYKAWNWGNPTRDHPVWCKIAIDSVHCKLR